MSDLQSDRLSLTIRDAASLHSAYMPFLEKGGLFVPSQGAFHLGDEVQFLLRLMDEPEALLVRGRVVWMTPAGAQGHRQAGIGVEFSDQDAGLNQKIETYLSGLIGAERATHTL